MYGERRHSRKSHLYGGENEQSTVTFAFAAPQ